MFIDMAEKNPLRKDGLKKARDFFLELGAKCQNKEGYVLEIT